MIERILRVALYVRVSTEEQVIHGYSLEAQEAALIEHARQQGYKIAGIYRDEGNSARKPATKRKKMQELLADVEAGKIDLILFTKLDRWFRSVREYHTVQAVLDKNKVAWKAVLEDYQTTTADGRLKVNIMLSVAENEADRTSERIKFVFANKIRNGEYCYGGAVTPWGYKKEKIDGVPRLVKDPELEDACVAFWDKLLKYRNIRMAGRETNLEYGLHRAHKSWMSTVRSDIYTGELHGVKDFCPAYIDREDWETLQHPEWRIKATQGNRCYLFVGLIRCPVCGNTLKANYKTYPNDRSKEYFSYRCSSHSLGYCPYNRTLSERKIEKYLLENLESELEYFLTDSDQLTKKKAPHKKTDVKKLYEQLRRLNNIYIAGNIDDKEYSAQVNTIKSKIAEIERQEHQNEKIIDLTGLLRYVREELPTAYDDMTREDRQRFWHEIIDHIQLEDNQVSRIIFRY